MTILYCDCAQADIVPAPTKRAIRAALARADGRVEYVADLCRCAAERDPLLADLAANTQGPLHVVACYPRAVRWLFEFAAAPLPGSATIHNMRTDQPATILTRLGLADAAVETDEAAPPLPRAPRGRDDWIAWYPVIDRDRCTACKQCVEFCLFGAYAVDEDGQVRVASPPSCKLNCPACARVCPASAIIFPKFAGGGFIAGDSGKADRAGEDGLRSDLARLGHEDAYEILRQRAARARAAARAKYGPPKASDTE